MSDRQSKKIGVVGASSGYIGDYRTMVAVENHGMAVVGSWYLGRRQENLISLLMNQHLTAREKVQEFSRLINQDRHKRRVSLVTADFENASEPGRGCHQNNPYCGKFEDQDFTITGGGLESEDVILKTADVLKDPDVRELPFECRMYKGIEAIFSAGGEIKNFNRLSYMVDDVTEENDLHKELFIRRGHENNLLIKFKKSLKKSGFNCD